MAQQQADPSQRVGRSTERHQWNGLRFLVLLYSASLIALFSIIIGSRMASRWLISAAFSATPIAANRDWTPQFAAFNGTLMVQVPAGCFRIGRESNDERARAAETGGNRVCFARGFWLDLTEVTQAQFRVGDGQAAQASRFRGARHPVEQVTWFEANAFCRRRGARLPTEAEWEYAARGPDGASFPWGETPPAADQVIAASVRGTASVGIRRRGASWVGALDLAGNVWEWTNSIYLSYPYDLANEARSTATNQETRSLRGGAWDVPNAALQIAARYGWRPNNWGNFLGFRCARSDS